MREESYSWLLGDIAAIITYVIVIERNVLNINVARLMPLYLITYTCVISGVLYRISANKLLYLPTLIALIIIAFFISAIVVNFDPFLRGCGCLY